MFAVCGAFFLVEVDCCASDTPGKKKIRVRVRIPLKLGFLPVNLDKSRIARLNFILQYASASALIAVAARSL